MTAPRLPRRARLRGLVAGLLLALAPALQPLPAAAQDNRVIAVVNRDAITARDVESRRRLFQLTSRLPDTEEVRNRLAPQILRLLIDEKLRLQEVQRRRIVVADDDIAGALRRIEQQNNMPQGALLAQLRNAGIDPRTLIDQLRVQLGWTRLIRERLGEQGSVTAEEVDDTLAGLRAQVGRPEYLVSEIFIPIDDPARAEESERFAAGVIEQLRRGAPFAALASQFSQGAAAEEGGNLGWVQPGQLDEEVEKILVQMPPGAVSNPVRTAGGLSIVALHAKRTIGEATETVYDIRQVFRPWPEGQGPNQAAAAAMQRATQRATSCADMERIAGEVGSTRPPNPGPVRESGMVGPLRAFIARLPVGKPSQPIIATDGVAVIMVCARTREGGLPSREVVASGLLRDRLELYSRQLIRDLRRRSYIEIRQPERERAS